MSAVSSSQSDWELRDNATNFTSFAIYDSIPLGTGAFSVVFLGSCDGRPCAAKVFQASILDNQKLRPTGRVEGSEDPRAAFTAHGSKSAGTTNGSRITDAPQLMPDASRTSRIRDESHWTVEHLSNRRSSQSIHHQHNPQAVRRADNLQEEVTVRVEGAHKAMDTQATRTERSQDPRVAILADPSTNIVEWCAARELTEWEVMRTLRHPCVIQYLGLAVGAHGSGELAILMELATGNLTQLLRHGSPPLQHQVTVTWDVTRALAYLHRQHIMHRDLCSNNILMMEGDRAKVGDFGTARVLGDTSPPMMDVAPGTMVYMPPEALCHNPTYTYSLDVFSLGVLMVQICTSKYPKPRPRFRLARSEGTKEESCWVRVREVERRQEHLRLIAKHHPLLPLARSCLRDQVSQRPTTDQICRRIQDIRVSRGAPPPAVTSQGLPRQSETHH